MNIEREKVESQELHKDNTSSSEFRSLFEKILSHKPTIKHMGKRNEKGDLSFAVTTTELGITPAIYKKYGKILFSVFFANTMGELIVRENIAKFSVVLTQMPPDEYLEFVNKFGHKNFGIKFRDDYVVFTCHLNLLQSILTEDFKYNLDK